MQRLLPVRGFVKERAHACKARGQVATTQPIEKDEFWRGDIVEVTLSMTELMAQCDADMEATRTLYIASRGSHV